MLARACLLTALVGLAVGVPAQAAVKIGERQIVVRDDRGGRAVIERAPFGMTFTDAKGRTVLREAKAPPTPGPGATVDAAPGGFQIAPDVAQYAPLAFEIGGERGFQHPGGLWTGNMLTNGRAGAVHFPTRVTDVSRHRGGARLTLATTDPTRTLEVEVAPDRGSALRLRASVNSPNGVASIADSFESPGDESFHGFGGRHNTTDHRGQDFYNWIEEEAFNAGPLQPVEQVPGSGGDRYLFPNGQSQAYYVQNSFVSSRPYGFLFNRAELTRWRMASDRPDTWQVAVHGSHLDYTVAVGPPRKAIRTITAINGRHRVPPEWTLGPMLKRNVHQGNTDPAKQQQLIREDIRKIREHALEIDGYSYESWDTLPDEFVRKTNKRFQRMGIRTIGYTRAYANDDGNFDPPGLFQEAVSNGYVAMTPAGTPFISVAVGPAALYDPTDPGWLEWWERRKIGKMLRLGFDGFMQDFGEQVVADMRFDSGETGATMHNRYPILFHKATRGLLDEWHERHPRRDEIWMYTRSGFSGRPGSAAYESANFPGDESTDWSRSNGIAFLTTDMLNRGLGGAYGYSTDIGGYFDNFTQNGPLTPELFARWIEWAALTPVFRLHNSCCEEGTRMPWDFDGEVLPIWRKMVALRERAEPLIERLWRRSQKTGLPITRPMWLHYPNDRTARAQDQQWMLGRNVLVAPVVRAGATSRDVYFPRGCWRHRETGRRYKGPASIEVKAPLESLPWFARCGTRPLG
jgi:alpha-glucosidase (family GH31 glycosyl hydrolase)